jgi:hypothetical protein
VREKELVENDVTGSDADGATTMGSSPYVGGHKSRNQAERNSSNPANSR